MKNFINFFLFWNLKKKISSVTLQISLFSNFKWSPSFLKNIFWEKNFEHAWRNLLGWPLHIFHKECFITLQLWNSSGHAYHERKSRNSFLNSFVNSYFLTFLYHFSYYYFFMLGKYYEIEFIYWKIQTEKFYEKSKEAKIKF